MTFSDCIETGDRFLAWYQRATRKAGADPKSRDTFDRGWDRWAGKHGDEWRQVEVNAIWLYCAASLGFRRQHRPRYRVRPEDIARCLEPEIITDAQLAQERGYPQCGSSCDRCRTTTARQPSPEGRGTPTAGLEEEPVNHPALTPG